MRRTLMMIAATVAAGVVAAGCGGAEEPAPAAVAPVSGTAVAVTDTMLPDVFEASGVAEPIQRAMVGTKLMARVTEVLVKEGDRVRAGQVLLRLDARDITAKGAQAQAGIGAAEAMHQEALAQATRIRALYADSAAPKAQLDAVEAGLARAEAAVWQARAAGEELDAVGDYATLRAPFAGIVTQRMVDVGAFAAPGQPLVMVEDQSSLRISVTAAPDAVRGVTRGQLLEGTVAGHAVTATVEGVASAPGGHVVTVNAIVANTEDAAFAGSAATLALPMGVRRVITAPAAAVVREGDLTGVRVKTATGADLRWVRIGRERGGQVEILSGLSAGDQVIVPAGTAEGK
ncbi:MAG TPA: efflux RND transporter periplasmic adaptor subunit [Gemmatimonadales bacterium]